ncbi:PH domain-containing protein YHR131C-like [Tripterygium wilfordii]|uniref:PH domain-containing protein YHR131C-like n=1 Tax=Tripterygium wilfordii TaxID=458696 RepID=UPI0018F8343F|nr:PH domain-containing protein YHR131C-like [Tripterygium wilfordii]
MNNLFSIKIHHGGSLEYFPTDDVKVKYVGGILDEWPYDCGPDDLTLYDVVRCYRRLGYRGDILSVYYRIPSLDLQNGLKPLRNNIDFSDMMEVTRGHNEINLYTRHLHNIEIPPLEVSDTDEEEEEEEDKNEEDQDNDLMTTDDDDEDEDEDEDHGGDDDNGENVRDLMMEKKS